MGTIGDVVLSTVGNFTVGAIDGYLSSSGTDFNSLYTAGAVGSTGVAVYVREYLRMRGRLTGENRMYYDGTPSGQATIIAGTATTLAGVGSVVGYGVGYLLSR